MEEALENLNKTRARLSQIADKLVILNGESIGNVALELELFTQNRVRII